MKIENLNEKLLTDEIHVWLKPIDRKPVEAFIPCLSQDEAERARKMLSVGRREEFCDVRSFLRVTLSKYLPGSPSGHNIQNDLFGKPRLFSEAGQELLHFNVTHSGEFGLIALSRSRHVGVDIEKKTVENRLERISRRFLTPNEREFARTLSENERVTYLYKAWTRKEALLKAVGCGISVPLDQIELPQSDTLQMEGSSSLASLFRTLPATLWNFYVPEMPHGYEGVLCYSGAPTVIRFFKTEAHSSSLD